MRRSERTLGLGGTEQYVYVQDELVVHRDDSEALVAMLGDRRASSRTAGSYEVWALRPGTPVPDLMAQFRRLEPAVRPHSPIDTAGNGPLLTPHFAFSAAGRVIMSSFAPMATKGRLDPIGAGGSMLPVGVIDTGVLHTTGVLEEEAFHPWFEDRIQPLEGSDFADSLRLEDGILHGAVGHGTLVAGAMLAEAPRAAVVPLRVTDDTGSATDEAVATALHALDDANVRLINLSFSGRLSAETSAPPIIEEALRGLDDDVVVVAAAGNFGSTAPVWPAASGRVIAVGAVEEHPLGAAPFSGHGAWVDVYAPASVLGPFCFQEEPGLLEACRPAQTFEGWARGTGTSFAAAVVTGRIAQLAISLGISPREAADKLLADAQRITVGDVERPYVPATAKILPG